MPVAAAIDLVDQWVAFFGFSSSVLTMTRSTSASVIFRGTPVIVGSRCRRPVESGQDLAMKNRKASGGQSRPGAPRCAGPV
jgi:hypothetical protein